MMNTRESLEHARHHPAAREPRDFRNISLKFYTRKEFLMRKSITSIMACVTVALFSLISAAPAVASPTPTVDEYTIVGELGSESTIPIETVRAAVEHQQGSAGSDIAVLAEPVDGAYKILSSWTDSIGRLIVMRAGSATWGSAHVAAHNLTTRAVRAATQGSFQRIDESASSTVYRATVYRVECGLVTCTPKESKTVRVVVNPSKISDNKPRGVITAYCEGVTVCPDWVKNAANI